METQINKDKGFGVKIGGAYGTGNAQRYGLNSDNDLIGLLTTGITNLKWTLHWWWTWKNIHNKCRWKRS